MCYEMMLISPLLDLQPYARVMVMVRVWVWVRSSSEGEGEGEGEGGERRNGEGQVEGSLYLQAIPEPITTADQ